MARFWQRLTIRDSDLDDEYGLGGGGGSVATPPPPDRGTLWRPGRLVSPGEVIEPTVENGFQYTAIQAAPAYTGTIEPAWPVTPGGTVVDGGVTWQASAKTSITWQAIPLYKSGAAEPAWPVAAGSTVTDNTITWTARVPYVDDPYCPRTKLALVIASKVFKPSAAGDVVRYCATNDATDWSTADDAGFLPTGMKATAEVECTALAEYRGNMVAFTASDFTLWQVDPDPAQMQHLDTIPGLGTIYPKAVASVASDLLFLTPQGVRSVGIAAASTNLQDDDVGTPVDTLIRAELPTNPDPRMTYLAGLGEVWLNFGAKSYVFQRSRAAKIAAWSRDEYPFSIDAHAHLHGDTYLRSGDKVYRVNRDARNDGGTPFDSVIHYPHLDLGAPGVTKMMIGVDIVAAGAVAISLGYDQTNDVAYTTPVAIGPDTVPGSILPIPVSGASFAPKLTFAGADNQTAPWKFTAMTLYLNDFRPTA